MRFPRMLPLAAIGVLSMSVADATPIDIAITAIASLSPGSPINPPGTDVFGLTPGNTAPFRVTFTADTDRAALIPAGTDIGIQV